ncbi:MAG TPA: Crp/Fnr family transcriptional regulator [Candidatus Saccharimonadales bacterium]|nr:Crp/Fnr family transcriptional regulator [Candidatus Saccharimonadales bacterium]
MILPYTLSLNPLAKLTAGARIKPYPKNQIILYGGDKVTDIFVLKKGVAKIYDIDHQGNEKVLHILKPPAIMPLGSVLGQDMSTEWFYSAVTDCEVYAVSRAEAEKRILADSRLAAYVMDRFSREMHEVMVRLSGLGKTDVRGKLTYVLRFLAVYHAKERRGGWRRVEFPVGHQLLADMIGMTRESTAIGTKHLRDHQIIRYPRATLLEINFTNLLAYQPVTT